MIYTENIRRITALMGPLKTELVEEYLKRKYALSGTAAAKAVHAALRDRRVREKNGYIYSGNAFGREDSERMNMAFRVALRYIPDVYDLERGTEPWQISFIHRGLLVQICVPEEGSEEAVSMMLTRRYVFPHDRERIRRIAVISPSCDPERIRRCGFSIICSWDGEEMKVARRYSFREAWSDMQEEGDAAGMQFE